MRVAVYCSSSDAADEKYRQDAESLGTSIGQRGHELVYGGGNIGSMGVLAIAATKSGARVVSVIPHFFNDQGLTYNASDEILVTEDMQQRKREMWERADAAIALPGGYGTLEELTEILVLNQLDLVEKPLVLANLDGFWDPLLQQFDQMVSSKMTSLDHQRLVKVAPDGSSALSMLEQMLKEDR